MKKIYLLMLCLVSSAVYANNYYDSADAVKPLLPGMQIPEFTAKNPQGEALQFSADSLSKPFVLSFYRGGWCPYCNAHLGEMRQAEKKLVAMGFDVYFISADKPENLISTLKDNELRDSIDYQLLSDADMSVSKAFGIAFKVDDETYQKYLEWGLNLEQASGHTHHLLPAPSTYLVGQDGVIQFQYTNPNYKIRLAPSILLAAAEDYLKRQPKK
ncbi:MAG: AhpC/TSA family protein [Proteobacteria bacterium]|nr:AhpC/TSA family protein [Pseudomonadota bacterium]